MWRKKESMAELSHPGVDGKCFHILKNFRRLRYLYKEKKRKVKIQKH